MYAQVRLAICHARERSLIVVGKLAMGELAIGELALGKLVLGER